MVISLTCNVNEAYDFIRYVTYKGINTYKHHKQSNTFVLPYKQHILDYTVSYKVFKVKQDLHCIADIKNFYID